MKITRKGCKKCFEIDAEGQHARNWYWDMPEEGK